MSLRPLWIILLIIGAAATVGGIHYAGGIENALFSEHSAKGWMLILALAIGSAILWRTRNAR